MSVTRRFRSCRSGARRWALLLCLVFSSPLAADDRAPTDAVETVIRAQLEAFSEDNDEAAFSYASPAIQRGFASAREFANMVRSRYPAVYEAATVRFREQVPHPGFVVQRVQLLGPNGLYWDAYYRMEREGEEWRIGGVVLEEVAGGI